jgi:hypothetical protein
MARAPANEQLNRALGLWLVWCLTTVITTLAGLGLQHTVGCHAVIMVLETDVVDG